MTKNGFATRRHRFGHLGFPKRTPHETSGAGGKIWENGWVPNMLVPVSDQDLELLDKLVEELEENDDVQEVYTNAE